MSIGTGKRKSLSIKQAKTLRLIKDRALGGEEITRDLLIECHDQGYGLGGDRKLASTYAGQNMRRQAFLANLELNAPESQHALKDVLWKCVYDPGSSERKQIAAVKILAGAMLGQKHTHELDEGIFKGRSQLEIEHFATHGDFPKTIESSTIQ